MLFVIMFDSDYKRNWDTDNLQIINGITVCLGSEEEDVAVNALYSSVLRHNRCLIL